MRHPVLSMLFFILLLQGLPALAAPVIIPAPPSIAASSYILIDANSGKVIAEKNADQKLPPASLTKLMTSYVVSYQLAQGEISNDDRVAVSRNAWAQNPVFAGSSLMWIEVGKQVSLGDLHRGIVISSGNDASVALAEHLASSEEGFADVMNQHARLLGMTNSNFANSHGLPADNHYMTARDLATLSQAILQYPEEYALYSEREFTFNNITQQNRNRLLWQDSSVDGLKTGHTEQAGYCLVTSAKKAGMRLISVVMGAKSQSARESETKKLLAYGFRYYETHQLYSQGDQLSENRLWGGKDDRLALGVERDIHLTMPRGRHADLQAVMNINQHIKAPITQGREYGELVISLEDEELLREPLVALQSVEQSGIIGRLWDSLVLFFSKLFGMA